MSRVYAIEGVGTGLIKLGRAFDPAKRLCELHVFAEHRTHGWS